MAASRRIAETLASAMEARAGLFLDTLSCGLSMVLAGQPGGRHAMVEARRMVRWHFGRDYDPVSRKLAQVLSQWAGLQPSS